MIPLHSAESTVLSIGAANPDIVPDTKRIVIAGTPESLIKLSSQPRQKAESFCISEQFDGNIYTDAGLPTVLSPGCSVRERNASSNK
jgi:hypothetical protein